MRGQGGGGPGLFAPPQAVSPSAKIPDKARAAAIRLESIMCSVAEGLLVARLAAEEEDLFGGRRIPGHRREAGAFVRAVAEWLAFGAPTGTPEILLSSSDIDRIGRFLRW